MPPETDSAPRSRLVWVVIPLVLLGLVGLESLRTRWMESGQPSAEAEWIWIRGSDRWSGPRAFYAVRDFDLETVPDGALLSVMGDEEYVVYLNGTRVGSNRYTLGAAFDRFEVASLLVPGRNRLAIHLRSVYAHGGMLATLRLDDASEPMLVTDESWGVSRRRLAALMRPELDLERPERAIAVARPPAGRWGQMGEGIPRPLHADLVLDRPAVRAHRRLEGEGKWQRHGRRGKRFRRPLGELVTFEWREPQTGFLTLTLPDEAEALGLVYLGDELPDPVRQPPDATVITLAGQTHWADTVPRTFRYALVVGLDAVRDARIVRTDPTRWAPVAAGAPQEGVFGLPAPRLRTAIENVVWGELESLAGDAEGQL